MTQPHAEQATLHTLWSYQLVREYGFLLAEHRLPLRPATVRVEPMVSRWGSWDAGSRTVRISAALIETHAWDVVIEVLKHEVAHQLVSEHFFAAEAHGPLFTRACAMLGVLPWAAAASGELPRTMPSWRARALSPEQERLMVRVQKLLALAGSSNEHEAGLAMQRVREIYARYNLDTLTAAADGDVVHLLFCRQKQRIDAVETRIFSILLQHFCVDVIYCRQYDARRLCSFRAVEVIGRREHVLMAEHIYHFLHQQLASLWGALPDAAARGAVAKRSYLEGVLIGFEEKLERGAAAAGPVGGGGAGAPGEAGLIRRDQPEVAAYVRRRHPRLRSGYDSGRRFDPAALQAGRDAGAKIALHGGVAGAPVARGRLLG